MNEKSVTLPVHEMFHTFQGEGIHMGRAAFFVRLFGCPVHCPWCDSAGTWHPEWTPKDVMKLTPELIAGYAASSGAPIVVITGGEPAVYDLEPLVIALVEKGLKVNLETSGGFSIKGGFDWITLSPKKWKPPLAESVCRADEFKIIVEAPADIKFYLDLLRDRGWVPPTPHRSCPVWLHPEWSQRENADVLDAISHAVKHGAIFNLRAGWQLHKLYKIDALDPGSRPLVPLGGVKEKGY
jgi:7-carboxy-7-deazaguanine synthase